MANLDDDRTSSAHAFLKFGKCAVLCFCLWLLNPTRTVIVLCFTQCFVLAAFLNCAVQLKNSSENLWKLEST